MTIINITPSITGLMMSQLDKTGGYDAYVEWDKAADATSIRFTATNGKRTITETLPGTARNFTIPDVQTGEVWEVTVVAVNDKGTSLATRSSLRIGKTAIGFLSVYATPDELVKDGDDDEASAWLWLHANYPTAEFVSFNHVKSVADVDRFRVLFWMRDLEGISESDVWNIPANVEAATPAIRRSTRGGGKRSPPCRARKRGSTSCILWRLETETMKSPNGGKRNEFRRIGSTNASLRGVFGSDSVA